MEEMLFKMFLGGTGVGIVIGMIITIFIVLIALDITDSTDKE